MAAEFTTATKAEVTDLRIDRPLNRAGHVVALRIADYVHNFAVDPTGQGHVHVELRIADLS